MRKIIVRTSAREGDGPVARFFTATAAEPGEPTVGRPWMAASPVDDRVLRWRYGAGADAPRALPRAAWTIRLGG